jgi:2-polyprenyl-6-methoxyphenol hydroxylase-like FAD-dependent oxidoreductase
VDVVAGAKVAGDFGFVKYLAIPADGGLLSVTLAVPAADSGLRAALRHPDRFDRAVRHLRDPAAILAAAEATPVGPVHLMGGLVNRTRHFLTDDGHPRVLGFHAVGDAHTCTNPLYGRGCSLALVQAGLLADALSSHPDDPVARAVAYEEACRREIQPWFDLAVQSDGRGSGGGGGDGSAGFGAALRTILAAGETDPIIGRAALRVFNLLVTPEQLLGEPEVMARIAAVLSAPRAQPVTRARLTRDEFLAAAASAA